MPGPERLRGAARVALGVKLRELYDGGMTSYEIAERYRKSQAWAYKLLTEAGTVFRETGKMRPGVQRRPTPRQSKRTFGG